MLQFAKGLGPEMTFSGPTVNVPADVGPAMTRLKAAARASDAIPVRERMEASSL